METSGGGGYEGGWGASVGDDVDGRLVCPGGRRARGGRTGARSEESACMLDCAINENANE